MAAVEAAVAAEFALEERRKSEQESARRMELERQMDWEQVAIPERFQTVGSTAVDPVL